MQLKSNVFQVSARHSLAFTWGDLLALLLVCVSLYVGALLAFNTPAVISGPDISLDPTALPWYALLSLGRMAAAYTLSLLFSLLYGRVAAYHRRAEQLLMPLLDVLQSVPILSFLPVVLLSLSAFLPQNFAAELASIVLIFTSQAWNLAFAWYQSLTTIPKELREASSIFRLNTWMKFKTLELPFGTISLVWNSMLSWAGGWFFLMAAETFTVGNLDFRMPGLGSYLREAANEGNFQALAWGLATLVLIVILLDQVIWRPLIAWSDRFRVDTVQDEQPPTSWFYDLMGSSRLLNWLADQVFHPLAESIDRVLLRRFPAQSRPISRQPVASRSPDLLAVGLVLGLGYGVYRMVGMLASVPLEHWIQIGIGSLATFLRVAIAMLLALAWTVPVGVAIGTNRKLAAILQPVAQVTASIPATALFSVILLVTLSLPNGMNLAAVVLMLMGTQWYLLFNIIAGASAIPQDLLYTTRLLKINGLQRWRTLILPAIFPYLVTGGITASGGAWNASIVAEYQIFEGQVHSVTGIGAQIAHATAAGDYPHLLAATLFMILVVILINRLFWRRLYRLAEDKYRIE